MIKRTFGRAHVGTVCQIRAKWIVRIHMLIQTSLELHVVVGLMDTVSTLMRYICIYHISKRGREIIEVGSI